MATTIPDALLEGPVNYHALRVNADGELEWESLAATSTADARLPEDDAAGATDPLFTLFTPRNVVFNVLEDGNLRMVIS